MNLKEAFKYVLYKHKWKIIIFIILIISITIIGYILIFDYYKDIHKNTYYIMACSNGSVERYESYKQMEDSILVCGELNLRHKYQDPLRPEKLNINFTLD